MVRSSGIPRTSALGGITKIIASRTSSTSVTRVEQSKGSLDETTETKTEHIEYIHLFNPEEDSSQTLAGERISGDLGGLAIADGTVDIERGDRVTHGGVEYEVDTIVGRPDEDDPNYWAIAFTRRQ